MNDSRVYGYIRVSYVGANKSTVSPDTQLEQLIDYKRRVLPNIPWGSEGDPEGFFQDIGKTAWNLKSGSIWKRQSGSKMLQLAKPGDHILFLSVDRGFRNVGDMGQFVNWCKEKQIHAHFVRENINLSTPAGIMQAQILAAAAEYYSTILSHRTKEAMAIKRQSRGEAPRKKKKQNNAVEWEKTDLFSVEAPEEKPVPGRLWCYTRVSGYHQVESGLSLENQREVASQYAKNLIGSKGELTWDGRVYEDAGVSAFHNQFKDRPMGREIFEGVKAGDHVIALRFDRIFRSIKDMIEVLERFDKLGVTLHLTSDGLVSSSKNSRQTLHMLAVVAQMESDIKSARMKEVFKTLKDRGQQWNNVPMFHKIVRRGNKKRICYDYQAIVDTFTELFLRFEYNWSIPMAAKYAKCIAFYRDGKEPKLKDFFGTHFDWKDSQKARVIRLRALRGRIDPALWDTLVDKGREACATYVPEYFLRLAKWTNTASLNRKHKGPCPIQTLTNVTLPEERTIKQLKRSESNPDLIGPAD